MSKVMAIAHPHQNLKHMSFTLSSKIILDAIFGPNAIIGWASASLLMFMSHIEIKDIASTIAVCVGTIVGICTGGYAILRMRENYFEARSKARQEQHKLDVMEENEEDTLGV